MFWNVSEFSKSLMASSLFFLVIPSVPYAEQGSPRPKAEFFRRSVSGPRRKEDWLGIKPKSSSGSYDTDDDGNLDDLDSIPVKSNTTNINQDEKNEFR